MPKKRPATGSSAKVKNQLTNLQSPELAPYWLSALIESADDAIISKTLEGVITSWNAGAERVFALPTRARRVSDIRRRMCHRSIDPHFAVAHFDVLARQADDALNAPVARRDGAVEHDDFPAIRRSNRQGSAIYQHTLAGSIDACKLVVCSAAIGADSRSTLRRQRL